LACALYWSIAASSADAVRADTNGRCRDSTVLRENVLLQSGLQVRIADSNTHTVDELDSLAVVAEVRGEDQATDHSDSDDLDLYDGDEWLLNLTLDDHGDNWMMERGMDHEWLAGGGADDMEFQAMTPEHKKVFMKEAHRIADEVCKRDKESENLRAIWKSKYDSEHQKAVTMMENQQDRMTAWKARKSQRMERAGEVAGLWTTGSPGAAMHALENPLRSDGLWPGLRVITQMREVADGVTRHFHDPVSFLAGLVGLQHPHMDLLILSGHKEPDKHGASSHTSLKPRSDMAFWVEGHYQDTYRNILTPHKSSVEDMMIAMQILGEAVTPYINLGLRKKVASHAATAGWNLVAQSKMTKLHWLDPTTLDNVSLFQEPDTKECALAFVPTYHISQILVDLRALPATFCGIPNVHKGFRNQVRRAISAPAWQEVMKPAMNACTKLHLAGHSLGAGQAQLFAACLQRAPAKGEPGWDDYSKMAYIPDENAPRLLPAIDLVVQESAVSAQIESALSAAEKIKLAS
jgi:muconolactone delta-isomerase